MPCQTLALAPTVCGLQTIFFVSSYFQLVYLSGLLFTFENTFNEIGILNMVTWFEMPVFSYLYDVYHEVITVLLFPAHCYLKMKSKAHAQT